MKGLRSSKKIGCLASKKCRTAQIKLALVNDVEALLHVCAATKEQRKDYGK